MCITAKQDNNVYNYMELQYVRSHSLMELLQLPDDQYSSCQIKDMAQAITVPRYLKRQIAQ